MLLPLNHIRRREPVPSEAFKVYWFFAAERQSVFMRRAAGLPGPWTKDAIIQEYKFTNAYRVTDRVSQYLVRHVIYGQEHTNDEDLFVRIMLFKFFNRIETWELLSTLVGGQRTTRGVFGRVEAVLDEAMSRGSRVFSGAYIMPSGHGRYAATRKHGSYLRLLEEMLKDELPARLRDVRTLKALYEVLRSYPMMGPFLAFQYAIDLNYSPLVDFDEDEFIVAGPGALDGLAKCFSDPGDLSPEDLIRWTSDRQEIEFSQLGLRFPWLGGRRLKLIDIQNLFCEISKYTRVSHPDLIGVSNRTRIKQRFSRTAPIARPQVPPKWTDVNRRLDEQLDRMRLTEPGNQRATLPDVSTDQLRFRF